MNPEQFAYWFQGFAELTPNPPDARQWDQIRAHLALVFKKVTPPLGSPAIPPVTPEQERASQDIQDMIRRYEESKKKPPVHIPWTPNYSWPTLPYDWVRDSTGRPAIIC